MTHEKNTVRVSKKWRTCSFILAGIVCIYLLSTTLNRAKFKSLPYTGHMVGASAVISDGPRDFLIVLVTDNFPNSTETASVKAEGDTLKVYFKLRNSLFPEFPFGKSKNTFGNTGDWDHVFAFEISNEINKVIDMRTGEILWKRTN